MLYYVVKIRNGQDRKKHIISSNISQKIKSKSDQGYKGENYGQVQKIKI
jgi:hypothetical protein